MTTEEKQVRPLTQVADRPSSGDDDDTLDLKRIRRRKIMKWCVCMTCFLLLVTTVIIVLIFTVFRVRDPIIRMNGFRVTKLELINKTIPKPGVNMSVIADVSVKNPNAASFRYSNTTATLYYHGITVGEARGPPGQSKARRTTRMNITIDIITDRLLSSPNLSTDVDSGLLTMSIYSTVPGRVKILNLFRKHVVVKTNCTATVNISSQAIKEQKCKRKVII
ncbi:hypothetical protein L6164_021168 [Bauhinia variegata]|uniref:Uncharacterized protein n=1 Tax=Bauhinia variegata TaxID=167791 RepID=A0ACB9MY57_BAUVA|nr:hypothetical protein L6164_021168 [Bauhinia variegata]